MQQFDVVVLGAGMVGAAVALGFARKSFNVAIVEPNMPAAFNPSSTPDLRVSAISLASESLLSALGVWDSIAAMRVHPYRRLAVWEDESSFTEFDASDSSGEAHSRMGHMVENRVIQLGIHQALSESKNVHWFNHYHGLNEDTGELTLNDDIAAKAQLVIVAEGAQSSARQNAGIATQGWQYRQSVLSITVKCHHDEHQQKESDLTWQRFVSGCPKAFLPLFDDYAALIWYDQIPVIQRLTQLSNNELKKRIISAFPERLPDFDIVETGAFPITRMHAQRYFKGRMVLVGDSAHTINPLAGQGVNLGFKDVEALLKHVTQVEDASLLQSQLLAYEQSRKPQNLLMMSTMDAIYNVFASDALPLKFARNVGLKLANNMGWAKDKVMRYAMGLN
ncbi:FAD-dependent monooxygenase [Alteromonas sp. a30]|uniref:FAD-dependent monooxygenase n=1 Tax=Alteromonas sp. a30 TaxID=2730917 RepID=UPI00227E2AE9|nr:FAD-dependent monooxygenase [Alteromonas sp. a30]MCY7295823.1 2-octaprenyl-3-methyl-6-methoxy-1,4-benzoquinol hydroxylase [Alteromonas sp. a30]